MHVVDRLVRNSQKQKEYRHIITGTNVGWLGRKRMADAFFLRKYAGLTLKKVAIICDYTPERVRQIVLTYERDTQFTICHPARSCMLNSKIL